MPHAGLGLATAASPWTGGASAKRLALTARTLASLIVLQRDSTRTAGGSVSLSLRGEPVVHYRLHPLDAESMTRSSLTAFRILAAAGATSLATMYTSRRLQLTVFRGVYVWCFGEWVVSRLSSGTAESVLDSPLRETCSSRL